MSVRRSEAIKKFLDTHTHPDLARLYSKAMEVQVNVAKDMGERVESGDFRGKAWIEWTDGVQKWASYRVPKNANSEPEDNDYIQGYDLEAHAEGVGMTGWNWQERKSYWVAYDFDAMLGHSDKHAKKLSDKELQEIQDVVTKLPFITLRKSTSGRGLHLYIFLEPIATANHTEHAALARSILSMVAGLSGFNFTDKVDIAGGNMWVWHRKQRGTDGLRLIREGERLGADRVPANWRDHLNVVTRRATRAVSAFEQTTQDVFDELTGQRAKVKLDAEHLKLVNWLSDRRLQSWWDADNHMLVTHTSYLAEAHKELRLRGEFHTMSSGKEYGTDVNCFAGETEVITREGVKTLKELSEQGRAELLVWTGKKWEWVSSDIKHFGKQKTMSVLFGNDTVVRATANHRWLFMNNGPKGQKISKSHKLTTELVAGKTSLPIAQRELPVPSDEGYAHGFIYGDGNKYEQTRGSGVWHTRVTLFKHDEALKSVLQKFGVVGFVNLKGVQHSTVYRLPATWKELPENCTPEYALGFILGLMSADGFVHGQSCSIHQAGSYEMMCQIRNLAVHAGLQCYGIKRVQTGGGYETNLPHWQLRFSSYNIREDHLLRKDHKKKLQPTKTKSTTPLYIGPEDREEDVYCAVVPGYHNFTLANGVTSKNCFMYPCRNGVWSIRRYGVGTKEHKFWKQDSKGFTRCFYNRELVLEEVARLFDAVELENRMYQFHTTGQAVDGLLKLGVECKLPEWIKTRQFKIKENASDGKYICYIPRLDTDDTSELRDWAAERSLYKRIYHNPRRGIEDENSVLGDYDEFLRHVVSEQGEDLGWVISDGQGGWRNEPIAHAKLLLKARGIGGKDVDLILGAAVSRAWTIVSRPFQPEYPGDRQWNRSKAKFKIAPTIEGENLTHPTWDRILGHCGGSLTTAIRNMAWCRDNGVTSGAEYLKLFLACLIRHPQMPLPYLGFFGDQNSGKSTFHEMFCDIILAGGYTRADTALSSNSGFNGELYDNILCIIEETDVGGGGKGKAAYNRLKDWVTSSQISIHPKGGTPFMAPNYTHWIQCANIREFIPVFAGDTRVTLIHVPEIPTDHLIPKRDLRALLIKEAPDFLASLLSMDIPDSRDRLMLPVIRTQEKEEAEYINMNPVQQFFKEKIHHIPGAYVSAKDLYKAFIDWCDPTEALAWTSNKFGREIPKSIVKGRISETKTQDTYYANISLQESTPARARWISAGTFLRQHSE